MNKLIALLAVSSLNLAALAADQTFDFKDPKGVNHIGFKMDAPLESISGHGDSISGTVTFDPAKPAGLKGKIVLATTSLIVPNNTMKTHMHGAQWLDVAKFPEITFETAKVENVKTTGDETTADITGTMTIKGTAKQIKIPVKMTYLKDKLKDRSPNLNGDLLVLRSEFTVKRSEFGINAGKNEDKVSDTIQLSLSIAGQSPK